MIPLSRTVAIVLRGRRRSVFVVPSITATAFWTALLFVAAIGGVVPRWLPLWAVPVALLCGPFVFTRLVTCSRGTWSVWLAVGPLPVWRACVSIHRPDFIGIDDHQADPWDSDRLPPVFHRCVVDREAPARVRCFRPRALADALNAEPGRLSAIPAARSLPRNRDDRTSE
ncbi:MAG: hypothetical protein HS111_23985 [Kofleriaceae bacterium]|nr:hypothetical protein [Kofleriaceae bacterium]MCL4224084.1 hypothetical protein [Myxococcales bacterium]